MKRVETLAHTHYPAQQKRRVAQICAAFLVLLALLCLDMVTGPSGMSLGAFFEAFIAGPNGEDRAAATILWQIRLPQSLMAVIVGCALGVCGLQMQTILDNPLASPFTLGFSASAGFGAALAIMFGHHLPIPGYLLVPFLAFTMTLLACGLIYAIAHYRGATPAVLALSGIAVLFFFQSLQSLLQFMASPEVLQQIVFWLFGSLLKANWTSVIISGLILLCAFPLVMRDAWKLTTLRLGDAHAVSLGLNTQSLRRRNFILVTLLTAAAVSFVGTIGFVGLIAPHVARSLVGEDHRFAIPAASFCGAIILLTASVIGKTISPGASIPVGLITAIAGIPMLMAVILRQEKTL